MDPATLCTPIDSLLTYVAVVFSSGGTTLQVKAGDGSRFGTPSPTAPVRFVVVAASAVTAGVVTDYTKSCVFKATSRATDVLTVTLESGTAQGYAVNDLVFIGPTAQALIDIHNAINAMRPTVPDLIDLSNPAANLNAQYAPGSANHGRVLYCYHTGERTTRWMCVKRTDNTYEWEQF